MQKCSIWQTSLVHIISHPDHPVNLQELGLSFTTAVELPTGCSEVELIPGGAHVDVTKETEPIFDQGYEKKINKVWTNQTDLWDLVIQGGWCLLMMLCLFVCLRFFLEIMADTCGRTTANLEMSWVIGRTTWRDIFSCWQSIEPAPRWTGNPQRFRRAWSVSICIDASRELARSVPHEFFVSWVLLQADWRIVKSLGIVALYLFNWLLNALKQLLCVLFLHLACASKVQLFDKVCSSFLLDRHVRRSRAWDSHLWLFHRLQRCRPQRAHGLCRRLQWSSAAASNIRQLFKHVQLQIYNSWFASYDFSFAFICLICIEAQ